MCIDAGMHTGERKVRARAMHLGEPRRIAPCRERCGAIVVQSDLFVRTRA